jgi:tRNA A37 threonylcarbamoyladenosine modification protein TsaB
MAHFAPRAYSYPSGATLAFRGLAEIKAGRAADPFSLVPDYIRDPDAVEKKKGVIP